MQFRTTHKILASGIKRVYYYVIGQQNSFYTTDHKQLSKPYPKDFVKAYEAAVKDSLRRQVNLSLFIENYLNSIQFSKKAKATQDNHKRHLKKVEAIFGKSTVKLIENRGYKRRIALWHQKLAATSPRQADHALDAFSVVLSHAVGQGELDKNPAKGIARAYTPSSAKPPWSESDHKAFLAQAGQIESDIYHLALYTGLRAHCLATIGWNAWQGNCIVWDTRKGRGRHTVVIPLLPEATAFLTDLKARQMNARLGLQATMLTGLKGHAMLRSTVSRKITDICKAAGLEVSLHQLRNSFVVLLIKAGYSNSDIANILGWNEREVESRKRVYAQREFIVAAQIVRLQRV